MIVNIFIEHVVPLLKYISHPALLQERKLNLYAEAYERNNDANMSKNSDKKEFDCHDSNLYWPTTIEGTIQRFTFLTIMEHTENMLILNKG